MAAGLIISSIAYDAYPCTTMLPKGYSILKPKISL
jgi:hypothetical protein